MNSKIKMIASDLDGTLLNSKGELSEENKRAIEELISRGVIFVPTTGRAFAEIPHSIKSIPGIRYYITSDGARLVDTYKNENVDTLISGKSAAEIAKAMEKFEIFQIAHKNGDAFCNAKLLGDTMKEKYKIVANLQNQISTYQTALRNFTEEFSRGEECEMLAGCSKDGKFPEEFLKEIEGISDIHVTSSFSGTLEIVSKDAGKKNALAALMNELSISEDEIITVGDSMNDYEMLTLSANSVAVENAIEKLKERAVHIGCKNTEHIAKYILDKFFD